MLKLENINITLGKDTNLERHVIKDLNLEVKKGEFIVIIGSNGAGKTTLFNAISGIAELDSGKVLLDKTDITNITPCKRASLISKVLQDPRSATIPNMTIEENLSFAYLKGRKRFLKPFKNKKREDLFKSKLKLLDMNLENRLNIPVSSLSGGQRQVLSLVMSLLTKSKLLLLDEITSALDPKMANLVMEITNKLVRSEKITTLMITHNMNHAISYGDRTILLIDGKIKKEYSKEEKTKLTPSKLANIFKEI
jgi:putative tryptophan/tyrosine transport system ATP-binding protein